MDLHIYPISDLYEHYNTMTCPCRPVVQWQGEGFLVTHNSFDGRERFEIGNKKYNKKPN